MTELILGQRPVLSVFELLGSNEDDMTYALGYSLNKSESFLKLFLESFGIQKQQGIYKIHLQKHHRNDKGFSDIEIWHDEKRLLIIEAKKGWRIPSIEQLTKYTSRFQKNDFPVKIGVISDCSEIYALQYHPNLYKHTSWKQVLQLSYHAYTFTSSLLEKNQLTEFSTYLSKLVSMDRIKSNMVFCVSLNNNKVQGSEATFIEIVTKYLKYFFPYGRNGWPSEAPNYVAFRFGGELRSIHKIEKFEVNDNLHTSMPDVIADTNPDKHFFFHLGPPIKPSHTVKNGGIWPNGRIWCMLDTLLTSQTIEEAHKITNDRIEKGE